MNFFDEIKSTFLAKRLSIAVFATFASYFVVRILYFTIDVFWYDESWHSNYMRGSLSNQLSLYQGFSPIYWVFGHVVMFLVGTFDIGFGRIFLRLILFSFYFFSIFLIYKIARKRNNYDSLALSLGILLILSAPISFYGGKAITPEYLQLFLFSVSLYFLSDEKITKNQYLVWLVAGTAAGLKLHALAILPFLFFFRTIILQNEIKSRGFFVIFCDLAKISVPCSALGLLLANFPIVTNFEETFETFKTIGATGDGLSSFVPKFKSLFYQAKDEECWETICPFYIKDGYSQLVYNILPPLSILFVFSIFFISATTKRNVYLLCLFAFSSVFIQIFIVLGHNNYPWYHLTYVPLLLSLALQLDIKNLSKIRKYAVYFLIIATIVSNIHTSNDIIKTDYKIRRSMSNLIDKNVKNTVCIDDILSKVRPDAYIFSVISMYNGHSKSLIDSLLLIERHFKDFPGNFSDNNALPIDIVRELSKKENVRLVLSSDEVSHRYNKALYASGKRTALTESGFIKEMQRNYPDKKVISKTRILDSCDGIRNYAMEISAK